MPNYSSGVSLVDTRVSSLQLSEARTSRSLCTLRARNRTQCSHPTLFPWPHWRKPCMVSSKPIELFFLFLPAVFMATQHPRFCPEVVLSDVEDAVQQSYMREGLSWMFSWAEKETIKRPPASICNYLVGRKLKWQDLSFPYLLVTCRGGVKLGKGKAISQAQKLAEPHFLLHSIASGLSSSPLPSTGMPFISLVPRELHCRQWHNWI